MRSRLCPVPETVNIFRTAAQVYSGQSDETSPSSRRGQCRRASFDTRGSVISRFSSGALLIAQAGTPWGSSTGVTGPRSRIRAASPWTSRPVGAITVGCVHSVGLTLGWRWFA